MLFHALTFAGSRGSCLNTRPLGRVFKHRPRDPASVNAMKQTCVIVILAYTALKTSLKLFLHWISQNKMASASNFRTPLGRHNVIYMRATFSRTKASAK